MPRGSGHPHLRHLQAPREHGHALVLPAADELRRLMHRNRETLLGRASDAFWPRHLPELRCLARGELQDLLHREAATSATAPPVDTRQGDSRRTSTGPRQAYEAGRTLSPDLLWVMTGHQPDLFHPGVWFKNFLAHALADREGAVAIHVVTDQDLARRCAVSIPSGSPAQAGLTTLEFDTAGSARPWESRGIEDWEKWESFGERCRECIREFVADPLVMQLWPWAKAAAKERPSPSIALSLARARLEESWGLRIIQVFLRDLCQGRAYSTFVAHLLSDLPRFHEIFHGALQDYRRQFQVRSRTHPAPALRQQAEWLEAPFWAWSVREPTRQPVFVRARGDQLCLSIGPPREDYEPILLNGACQPPPFERMAIELDGLRASGVCIRPRALTMTMYLRMLLADLFIHGLGGAKYDRLTDLLIERFFGLPVPHFALATATFLIPPGSIRGTESELTNLRQRLRESWYHPERFLGDVPDSIRAHIQELVSRKQQLVLASPPEVDARSRHLQIERLNAELRQWLGGYRENVQHQIRALETQSRTEEVLQFREFPYCIFSESDLRGPLLDLAERLA